jgi:hypothetical protein
VQARMISDNIGWDGNGFFCRRCGKAGYGKMAQVKGHLAMCPGTAISKGAIPRGQPPGQLAATSWQPVGSASNAGLTGRASYQQQQQLQPANNQPAYPNQPASQLGYPAYTDLNSRVSRLENEYQHALVERNAPGQIFGLDKNALMLILVVGLLIFWAVEQRGSQCPTVLEGKPKASKPMGKLSEKVMTKFTDRMATRAADSLFK